MGLALIVIFFYPAMVVAATDVFYPLGVCQIPAYGAGKAFFEADGLFPAEFVFYFGSPPGRAGFPELCTQSASPATRHRQTIPETGAGRGGLR